MARPPRDYRSLSAALKKRVVRWEHATFALDTLEPYECERGGSKPGRRLRQASKDAYASYGYDSDGNLLIAREGHSEQLHIHGAESIERLCFDRFDLTFISRAQLQYRRGRLVRLVETWPGKGKTVQRFEYDSDGRLSRVHVSRPLHVDELEYDATGQLVRVSWRHPTGEAAERFRRAPREDSLKLLLPQLHAKLVDEIPRVLSRHQHLSRGGAAPASAQAHRRARGRSRSPAGSRR